MKRVKRRYLALQLDSENVPSQKEFLDAVWGAIAKLYGEFGASLTSLALIDYNIEDKRAVLRANLATMDQVRTALASITTIAGKAVALHVLACSGTIKALRTHLKN
ncbi:MAG: Rpp14/Pop5 family protein [Candidatus Bathyarchaeota archaeon]|nr:Rpp14/Pop5 family protein [Candidatus Bathyarchaeota archaeon]